MDKHPWFRVSLWPLALTLAAGVPLAIGPTSPALAAWSAHALGSAAGAATVMPTGSAPAGRVSGTSVIVSWPVATFASGAPVAGYVVMRFNAVNGTPATVGSSCSGVVATTTCTEASVPAGSWIYTETPVQLNWTGGQSPDSTTVVVP